MALQEVLGKGMSLLVTVVPQEVNLLWTSMLHSGPTYCAFFIKDLFKCVCTFQIKLEFRTDAPREKPLGKLGENQQQTQPP